MSPFIEIPVEINTPICVIKANQHDGYWIEAELFQLHHLSQWGSMAFKTYPEAKKAADELEKDFRRKS